MLKKKGGDNDSDDGHLSDEEVHSSMVFHRNASVKKLQHYQSKAKHIHEVENAAHQHVLEKEDKFYDDGVNEDKTSHGKKHSVVHRHMFSDGTYESAKDHFKVAVAEVGGMFRRAQWNKNSDMRK